MDATMHPLSPWPRLKTEENAKYIEHNGAYRPAMLIVETINICNNDCIICPYSAQTRSRRMMTSALFSKLVADYVAIGGGPISLTPMVGEIFLDKYLPERLALLLETKAITTRSVTTNATMARRYDDARLAEILSAFHRVNISVYGLDADEYSAMTRMSDYELMTEQLLRIIRLATPGTVGVALRQLRKRTPELVSAWLAEIAAQAGVSNVPLTSNPNEYSNWSFFDTSKPLPLGATWRPVKENSAQCLIPVVALQVLVDGTVSFCACANFDGNEHLTLGNLGDASLAEMLESEKYRRLCDWQLFGVPEFCKTCSFHAPMEVAERVPWLLSDPNRFIGG